MGSLGTTYSSITHWQLLISKKNVDFSYWRIKVFQLIDHFQVNHTGISNYFWLTWSCRTNWNSILSRRGTKYKFSFCFRHIDIRQDFGRFSGCVHFSFIIVCYYKRVCKKYEKETHKMLHELVWSYIVVIHRKTAQSSTKYTLTDKTCRLPNFHHISSFRFGLIPFFCFQIIWRN